ncbi:MAG: glycosyltransferase family 39 protein [bacterium]|nr:glycosyltransferase family 39 protein [bacterium]
MHFLFFFIFASIQGVSIFWEGPQDSVAYTTLAKNLIEKKSYINISGNSPASWYTPGYPLFLALVFQLFDSWLVAIIIQNILASISAVLIFILGKKYISKSIGLLAALIYAAEPTNATISNFIWSEALFLFLFLLFVVCLFSFVEKTSLRSAVLAGLFLASAIYIRQVALLVVFVIPTLLFVGYIFKYIQPTKKQILGVLMIMLVVAGLLLPWSLRNKKLFDTYSLAGTSTTMLYFYDSLSFLYMKNAESPIAYMVGIEKVSTPWGNPDPVHLTREYHYTGDGGLSKEKELSKKAKDIIFANPVQYSLFHISSGFGGIMLQDTWRSQLRRLGLKPNTEGLSRTLSSFDIQNIKDRANFKTVLWIITGIAGHTTYALITILMLTGGWQILRHKSNNTKLFGLFLLGITLYFILTTGPAAYRERYRYPATPFIFLLASVGFVFLKTKLKDAIYGSKRSK